MSYEQPKPKETAIGMAWSSFGVILTRIFSFISTIVLGFIIEVETYAIFGLAATALVFITPFQNPGIDRLLIQKFDEYSLLAPRYLNFAMQMGILGGLCLLILGFFFSNLYNSKILLIVLFFSSLSIPIIAINHVLITDLSVRLKFKELNILIIVHSMFHYVLIIIIALLGANALTIAISTLIGSVFNYFLILHNINRIKFLPNFSIKEFLGNFVEFKWIMAIGLISAFALRGDFLVLGKMLSSQELGLYYFGIMLVMQSTMLISAAINRTLLPILSKLKNDINALKIQFIRISGAISFIASLLCLLLVGLSEFFIDFLWNGKWNAAVSIIIIMSISLPVRLMMNIGGAVVESMGMWPLRAKFLFLDALILIAFAFTGAYFFGMIGAVIGVSLQRLVSGIILFFVACSVLNIQYKQTKLYLLRFFTSFFMGVASIIYTHEHLKNILFPLGVDLISTIAGVLIFIFLSLCLNKDSLDTLKYLFNEIMYKKKSSK